MALLLVAVIVSFALSLWFAVTLNVQPWEFWVVFLAVAAILTALCNRLVRDYRAVRIKHHDDNTVMFAFSHPGICAGIRTIEWTSRASCRFKLLSPCADATDCRGENSSMLASL